MPHISSPANNNYILNDSIKLSLSNYTLLLSIFATLAEMDLKLCNLECYKISLLRLHADHRP